MNKYMAMQGNKRAAMAMIKAAYATPLIRCSMIVYVPSLSVLCADDDDGDDFEWKRNGVGPVDGNGTDGKVGLNTGSCIRYTIYGVIKILKNEKKN